VSKDHFLDLKTSDGIEILDYLSEKFEDKIAEKGKKLKLVDGLLINLARKEGVLSIDASRGDFYIKFSRERIKQINRRVANSTICCVYDPLKNIVKTTIVDSGEI